MIPWFFKLKGVKEFPTIRHSKRKKIIDKKMKEVEGQKRLINELSNKVSKGSRKVSKHIDDKELEDAKETLADVAGLLNDAEPVINNYVRHLLMLRLYEIMHTTGYRDPSELSALKMEIDFGLYSRGAESELEELLRHQVDPLKALGINYNDD